MPDLDLTAVVDAVVAARAEKIEHEGWCCANGCAGRHAEGVTCPGEEKDCECFRLQILHEVRLGIEAAVPLIESAVRERIAETLDAEAKRRDAEAAVMEDANVAWGVEFAADIVRGMK